MNEENLVGYLMEGVTILKNIRDANIKVNQDIDNFLKRLAEAAANEEPKDGDSSPKEHPSEAAEELSEKMKEMLKKIQEMQSEGKLGGTIKPYSKAEEEAMEKAQKLAMSSIRFPATASGVIISSPTTFFSRASSPSTGSPSTPVSTAGMTGVTIESKGATLGSGSPLTYLKPFKVKKLEKGDATGKKGSGPTSEVQSTPEVDADGMHIGNVYCAVCDMYHAPEDAP